MLKFQVENKSSRALRGIKALLECSCQSVVALPEVLQPESTYPLEFSVRAPGVGSREFRIPIINGKNEKLAVAIAHVHTQTKPPRVLSYPKSLHIIAEEDQDHEVSFHVTVLEDAEAEKCLLASLAPPGSSMRLESEGVNLTPSSAPGTVQRHYQFRLKASSNSARPPVTVQLRSQLSDHTSKVNIDIPVTVTVNRALSLAPAKLSVTRDEVRQQKQTTVFVVSQDNPLYTVELDVPPGINVTPVPGSTNSHSRQFSVQISKFPAEMTPSSVEFAVIIDSETGHKKKTLILPVNFVHSGNNKGTDEQTTLPESHEMSRDHSD